MQLMRESIFFSLTFVSSSKTWHLLCYSDYLNQVNDCLLFSQTMTESRGWQAAITEEAHSAENIKHWKTNPPHYRQTSLVNLRVLPSSTDDCAVWLRLCVCMCTGTCFCHRVRTTWKRKRSLMKSEDIFLVLAFSAALLFSAS